MSEHVGHRLLHVRRSGRAVPIAVVSVIVVLVVAVAWGVSQLSKASAGGEAGRFVSDSSAGPDWFRVEPRTFDLTVLATGELEARRKVEIKCEVEGLSTITELVDEGKFVHKGDVLVRMADDALRTQLEDESLLLTTAKADKIASEQGLAIAQSEARSLQDAADLKAALAELDLAIWQKGTDPTKQRELDLALEKATREKARAERDLVLSQQLEKEKFISKNELEDDEIRVLEARNALETAELNLDIYKNYTRPKEMRQANSDVVQAKAELDRTLRKNESTLAKARADLDSKQRALKIREDRLAKLTEQLDKTVIVAPQDGMVVYTSSTGSRGRRSDPIEQGRQVKYNEPILLLPDTSQMSAALRVHEALVRQVKKGQKVTVTIEARRGAPMQGTVADVGIMAVDAGWINPDLREYTVLVDLPTDADPGLKPSMRCSGQIHVGQVDKALAVPVQAVYTEGRRRYCYVAAGPSRVRRQTVQIGRASETLVEVRDGLSDGDQVLLRKPKPGEAIIEPAPKAVAANRSATKG